MENSILVRCWLLGADPVVTLHRELITNAFKFILQKREVDCENYPDYLGWTEVPNLAVEVFEKNGEIADGTSSGKVN